MERQIGVVMSGVEPLKLRALLLSDYVKSGDVVWNALVKIPYRNGFVVGVIAYYRGMNDLYESGLQAKTLSMPAINEARIIETLKQRKEYLIAEVLLLSAFEEQKGHLRRVPINSPVVVGTPVYRLRDKDLSFSSGHFYYLGRFYGEDILQPLYVQDFQTLGEAYHFVVAGQTGSGKSTMAMMLMCLYAKASKTSGNPMNFVVLSPVPEFVNVFTGKEVGSFKLNMERVFQSLGYEIEIYNEKNLVLDRWEILEELLLTKDVWNYLEIKARQNKENASRIFVDLARNKKGWTLAKLTDVPGDEIRILLSSENFINYVYSQGESRERVRRVISDSDRWGNFYLKLVEVFEFFREGRGRKVSDLARDLATSEYKRGRVVVVDIAYGGDIKLQSLLLREIVETIRSEGENLYRENPDLNLNTLIVLDEAHNYVPLKIVDRDEDDYRERLKTAIVKAFAETRKFGIGWMAISTRISLLDRKIYEHARVKALGYGLTTGMDREILREDFGKTTLERYATFADPSDPLSDRKHAFLIHGPITLISKTEPELMQAFSSAEEFLMANGFFDLLNSQHRTKQLLLKSPAGSGASL